MIRGYLYFKKPQYRFPFASEQLLSHRKSLGMPTLELNDNKQRQCLNRAYAIILVHEAGV